MIDSNNTGEIDYSEFLGATLSATSYRQENKLKVLFETFDENKDGYLYKENIKHALICMDEEA